MQKLKTNLGKSTRTFLSMMLIGILSLSLIGCSKDDGDENDNDGEKVEYSIVLDNSEAYNAQFNEIIYNDKSGLVTTDKAGFGFASGDKTGTKTVYLSVPANPSLKVKVYNPLNGSTAQMTMNIHVNNELVKTYILNVGSKATEEFTLTYNM